LSQSPVLDAFEVALRNPRLGRDVLEAQLFLLARGAQPLADRRNVRFDQLLVHRLAFIVRVEVPV
jgi:hypothetical protein